MNYQSVDPRLNDFLETLKPSDADIVRIQEKIFSGLNKNEEKLLVEIMEKNPSVAMAFILVNVPPEEVSLRSKLLLIMFPRFGKGPEHWKSEKTFILRTRSSRKSVGRIMGMVSAKWHGIK